MVLNEDKEFAINGKPKDSVREDSGTTVMSVRNRHHKPLQSNQHQEVEGRREKGASEAGVRLGRPIDSRAKTSCRVFALINYLVTIGILPNFSFISQNWVENSAVSARFRTERLRNNRIKSRKRMVTKVRWLLCEMCDSWVPFYRTAQKSWDPSTCTRLSPPNCWFAKGLWAHTRFSHTPCGGAWAQNTFASLRSALS